MTKEERKAYMKAWYQSHKEEQKAYLKAWYQAHKEEQKASMKAWCAAHREERKAYLKAWRAANKDYMKAYYQAHREEHKAYYKSDVNSLGQTKHSIRKKSRQILKQMHLNIPGYEIHHCFTYDDPSKFIYCSKETHLKIHQFLRDNNIDADIDHYEQIKHLLDEKVVTFGI